MTKEKDGITLVSLIITIIVMLIIFSVSIISATTLLDNAKLTRIQTSMYMIRARAETCFEQFLFDGDPDSVTKFEYNSAVLGRGKVAVYYPEALAEFWFKNSSGYEQIPLDTLKKVGWMDYDTESPNLDFEYMNMATKTLENLKYKYLYIRWGYDECVAQGIYKNKTKDLATVKKLEEAMDDDSIVDFTAKYVIVRYDLETGEIELAYTPGFYDKRKNKMVYTFTDIINAQV